MFPLSKSPAMGANLPWHSLVASANGAEIGGLPAGVKGRPTSKWPRNPSQDGGGEIAVVVRTLAKDHALHLRVVGRENSSVEQYSGGRRAMLNLFLEGCAGLLTLLGLSQCANARIRDWRPPCESAAPIYVPVESRGAPRRTPEGRSP